MKFSKVGSHTRRNAYQATGGCVFFWRFWPLGEGGTQPGQRGWLDGWNTNFIFGARPIFQGRIDSFREGKSLNYLKNGSFFLQLSGFFMT